MDKRLGKILVRVSAIVFAVIATLALVVPVYAQSPSEAERVKEMQTEDFSHMSLQKAILAEAIEMASDKAVGYSFDNCDRDPDVVCYTFVSHSIVDAGIDGISDELRSALAKEAPDKTPCTAHLSAQVRALEAIGYVRHDFSSFDDQDLVPGSVMYACGKSGGIQHVELYLGRYDLDRLNKDGNPVADDKGTPMTIGARIDDNDSTPGDQKQVKENCWLGGEVGAFKGNSRGEDYWTFYYAPSDLRSA